MILESYTIDKHFENEFKMWRVHADANHIPTYNHKHANFEISTIISGCGKYIIEDKCYDIECGDVFVFSSNEPHFISAIGKDGLELLNLQFSPNFINSNGFNTISSTNANFCFSHSKDFENRITQADSEVIRNELLAIFSELKFKNQEYKLAIKTHLCNIILELIRNNNYSSKSIEIERNTAKKLSKAITYIDSHFTEKIFVKDLSDITGLSENYFSTLFKKIYNISPNEYIISKRLELSTNYLSTFTEQNILDIALICGFNNTANFNKLFKKHYGITPIKYKNLTKYL